MVAKMITKILVPVDGSNHAERAVDFASSLAEEYGAELILLNVMSHAGSSQVPEELKQFAELEHVRITEADVLKSAANEIINNAYQRAVDFGVKKIERDLAVGDPAETIVDHVKGNKVDVVVMGRRGLGRIGSLLLGSVSSKVAQLADCTCITVK